LKCDKTCARWIGAPNGQVPLCHIIKGLVDARRFDDASPFLIERWPVPRSLDPKILGRRFSTIADNLELDLLAFIERGQTGFLDRRNVHKYILPAALRLDESVAFGWIKPLHSPGRHQKFSKGQTTYFA
jgi:hypothetical protein